MCQNTERPPRRQVVHTGSALSAGVLNGPSTNDAPLQGVGAGRPAAEAGWWLCLGLLWALLTTGDRLWLSLDRRLPSWDQADYLNSAIDHGRALGLLAGGSWSGWANLLDLSPKIPPLASLVNGTVMAVAGDGPDEASWALALWHGLLLLVTACWARQLVGRGFGLLSAALVGLTPSLSALRVDYTLDMAVSASSMLALWSLGMWQAPAPRGGRWPQAIAAALAVAASLLVKQSALLLVALPSLWAALQGLATRGRRRQVLAALALVIALLLPWLRHNWITAIGGTNRAVLESGAAEGDPPPLSAASWLWYVRRAPAQLGVVLPPGLVAAALALARRWRLLPAGLRHPVAHLPPGWPWLIGCALCGWLLTTLSPNKDSRYIAPVLPLIILLLARGWWQIGLWLRNRTGPPVAAAALAAGLVAAAASLIGGRAGALDRREPAPVAEAIAGLRSLVGAAPTTLVMMPSSPDLNEQTVTTYGLQDGGRILARRLGKRPSEHPLVLARAEWLLLATGDQGTDRPHARELSLKIRADPRFERLRAWPWSQGRQVEIWRRRPSPPSGWRPFDPTFIRLARGMEQGPAGLKPLFDRIGPEHQLDAHFLYQERVRDWARTRLERDPQDRDALWSLALLETLRNRPGAAAQRYARLQALETGNPWPLAYRAVVLLADGRVWQAREALAERPDLVEREPVLQGLRDLSRLLGGNPTAVASLRRTLPEAIASVTRSLERKD